MLDFIGDFFRYLAKMFHHTHIKSNCGNYGCDCDTMAESSSSGSSVVIHQGHHHHHSDQAN